METPVSTLLAGKGDSAVHTVQPSATVTEAVHLMNQRNIGAVAVMEGSRLAGIFTERDVLRRVIDGSMDPDQTPVSSVMTRELVVVRPQTTVGEALVLVDNKNCRHLPVVEQGRLVGMLSVRDLVGSVVHGQEHRIAELTDYIYGSYGPSVGMVDGKAE
ncbi:MAG: CBS domain-containing protein [Ectothiorhodospiraceae bacterium]|nr:CBS domain-containing protein [Ectothiorhodospiraceae bacterium]